MKHCFVSFRTFGIYVFSKHRKDLYTTLNLFGKGRGKVCFISLFRFFDLTCMYFLEIDKPAFVCNKCGKAYKLKTSLYNHTKYDCGKSPTFFCRFCNYKAKYLHLLKLHIFRHHNDVPLTS